MNHTRLSQEVHIPVWACRDKKVKKAIRLDHGKAKSDMTLSDNPNEYLLFEINFVADFLTGGFSWPQQQHLPEITQHQQNHSAIIYMI
jgi:hypothetical protein